MGYYNILMSVFNNLTLISVAYLNLFSQTIGHESLLVVSNYSCILVLFINKVTPQMASWLNTMVTLDRMICTFHKNRFKFIGDKRKLSLIVVGLFVGICVMNVPNLLYSVQSQSTFDPATNQTTLIKECTATHQVVVIRDVLMSSSRIVLPISLQLGFNAILIKRLFKSKQRAGISHSLSKEYQFAFTITILNLLYFVFELPFLVCLVLINVYGYNQSYISRTSNESAIASFAFMCSYVVSSFVYVSLFFVNVATNKIYRKECIDMWHSIKKSFAKMYYNFF